MIKVGIDCHNLEGERTGVGRYLANVLKESLKLPETRENFKFYLYFKKEIPKDKWLEDPLFVKKILMLPTKKSSFLAYFLFLLPWNLKKDKVDTAFFPCYMVPITWWGKSIVVLHDVIFKAFPHLFEWRYKIPYLLFSWWGAKHSKAIITISQFSKSEIIKYYNVSADEIFVTPLAVDKKMLQLPQNNSSQQNSTLEFKEKFAIEKDYILHIGQIFNRRHVDKAILAFRKMAPRYPNVQFVIVGKNKTNPWIDIERMIKETNIGLNRKAIIHRDYINDQDLILLYQNAKLSLYLSSYEGFGLPPLEAMSYGVPVLTTDLTALKETVGNAALIVKDLENIHEIAQKMEQGITDKILRKALIKKGLEQVKKFSWERCSKQTIKLFLKNANGA